MGKNTDIAMSGWIGGRGCVLLCVFLAFLASGCNFGPKNLEKGHIAYNSAVKAGADDELLLNIVRLRYLDTIDFMSTASVSSQLSFTVSLEASGGTEIGERSELIGGGASYSTRPTFTFIPQRGKELAKAFLGVEIRG